MTQPKKLTAKSIDLLKKPGKYKDPSLMGLYVYVTQTSSGLSRSFHFRARVPDKKAPIFLTLGKRPTMTLAQAHQVARRLKTLRDAGANSEELRKAINGDSTTKAQQSVELPRTLGDAFKQMCADQWDAFKFGPSDKLQQFETYWSSTLGAIALKDLSRQHVIDNLKPFADRPQVFANLCSAVNQTIKYVLALTPGYWSISPMPSREEWQRIIGRKLSNKSKNGHAAAEFEAMPQLWQALNNYRDGLKKPALSDLALKFIILTAARTGEVIGNRRHRLQLDGEKVETIKEPMKWREIDFDHKVWNVPAISMKDSQPHRVPLSKEAIEVLMLAQPGAPDESVFYSRYAKKDLPSNNYAAMLLKKLDFRCRCIVDKNGHTEIRVPTVHGMRSTFIEWSRAELIPDEISERALSHKIENQVRASYARLDLLKLRAVVMQMWADYLCGRREVPNPEKILINKLNTQTI